jgi:hypothetical protein
LYWQRGRNDFTPPRKFVVEGVPGVEVKVRDTEGLE